MSAAKTILEQLGGRRFRTMTGAHSFCCDGNSLVFRIPSNITKRKICGAKVTLTPADLYDFEFFAFDRACGMLSVKTVEKVAGIYFDQLQETFTEATGLETDQERVHGELLRAGCRAADHPR